MERTNLFSYVDKCKINRIKISSSTNVRILLKDLVFNLLENVETLENLNVICDCLKLYANPEVEKVCNNTSNNVIDVLEILLNKILNILKSTGSETLEPSAKRLVFEILEICIGLCPLQKLSFLISEVYTNLSDSNSQTSFEAKTLMHLYIFEIVLNLLPEKLRVGEFDVNNEILFKLNSKILFNTLVSHILSNQNSITSTILLSIFPKILNITKTNLLLKHFWEYISSDKYYTESVELSTKLYCLCSLADYYLSFEQISLCLVKNDEFWKIIQEGLVHCDPLLRKEALYLLKRGVELVEERNITFNTNLFFWKSSCTQLKQIWELIFIILEVLEEKQAHLVMPMFPYVLKVQEFTVSNSLHPLWLLSLYDRILKHDSIQVTKWGIINFLNINVVVYERSSYELTMKSLLTAINNMLLFCKNSDNILDHTEVEIALNKWFSNISEQNEPSRFLDDILNSINKVHWSPIPLFHFLNSFSIIKGIKVWNNSSLNVIEDFVRDALTTQTVYIRAAIQCTLIRILVNLSDNNEISTDVVMKTLKVFRHNECLCQGTETWSNVVGWLKTFITEQEAQRFIEEHLLDSNSEELSLETIATSLVLFFDTAVIFNKNEDFSSLEHYFKCLYRAGLRPYSCVKTIDKRINLITNILYEIKNDHMIGPDTIFYTVLQDKVSSILHYFLRRFTEIVEITDYDCIKLYIDFLNSLITKSYLISNGIMEHITLLQDNAIKLFIEGPISECPPIKQYFNLQIINWSAKYIAFNKITLPIPIHKRLMWFVDYMFKNNCFNVILCKEKKDENLTRNYQVLWGRLASESIQATWSTVYHCSTINSATILKLINASPDFIQQGLEALQIGGPHVILHVLDLFKAILPNLLNNMNQNYNKLSLNFIESSWKACFELRKMDLFWPAIKQWLSMVFQKEIITKENINFILHYSEQILIQAESITGIGTIFISQLREEAFTVYELYLLKPVLIPALLFGTLQRRDQRIENYTIEYIKSLGSRFTINSLESDISHPRNDLTVRVKALDIILKAVVQDRARGSYFVKELVTELLIKEQDMTRQKPRYYGDSLHHRVKNRILQNVLIFESVLAEKMSSEIFQNDIIQLHQWAYLRLKGESQQPSVRFQLEWLFVRTYLHCEAVREEFWVKFDQASKERLGSLCSFISVAYHLSVLLNDDEFTDECVQHILPGCMGQNFNVQLYAQTVLEKLLKLSPRISDKYKFLEKCIPTNVAQGNAARNALKLKQDFYFTVFHPVQHFSLQTIFCDLPRLSNLTSEEWIPLPELTKIISPESSSVAICNPDSTLSNFQTASWIVKASDSDSSENIVAASGVQKKFVPWKGMIPDCDMSSNLTDKSTTKDGLIVVASLIDKVPNLGGLSRTCEIFSVSSLVLGSLEYLQNKEFSVLSMSAEKHIRVTEVKPYNLSEYLGLMKKTGYTVVGAEQTAGSVPLDKFQFPEKCVLLLGNEKEGIPVNLIHLLDKCVEIPQYGVVRSLNVHVTGALFVWEYTKQHH